MELLFYGDKHYQNIEQFELTEEQLKYVRSPQENISLLKDYDSRYPIVGKVDENIVLFCVLDTNSEFKMQFEVENGIYVRSFSTDVNYVRQGYAKQALRLLPQFIRNHFKHVENIVLIVDEPNTIAKNMYIDAGFIVGKCINGERYKGNLMYYKL
ncbi:GNAT family N-acetyltransferase [Macrococcus armenti]|uniref:GNAT family N-acetyltransferase n=1 Tax=Macrococcus armenti TaxID=2875764 RepID=UPI001CCC2C63|nr:GNAT family N-acetyltransferase [Macrococcus armenti]UBH22442.1 GNAT family N-acetyltransferase [Macrococcus armenti]